MAIRLLSGPGQNGAGGGVHHVAERVNHYQDPHLQAVGTFQKTGAQAPLAGLGHAEQFAH